MKARLRAISSLHIFSQDFMSFNEISRTGRTHTEALQAEVLKQLKTVTLSHGVPY